MAGLIRIKKIDERVPRSAGELGAQSWQKKATSPSQGECWRDAIQHGWTFAPLAAWIERTWYTVRELRIIE